MCVDSVKQGFWCHPFHWQTSLKLETTGLWVGQLAATQAEPKHSTSFWSTKIWLPILSLIPAPPFPQLFSIMLSANQYGHITHLSIKAIRHQTGPCSPAYKWDVFKKAKNLNRIVTYIGGFFVVIDLMHSSCQTKICDFHHVVLCHKNIPCC